MPTHRMLDAAYEAAKGDAKIGTTGKGIGPTYTDKVSRNGLRVGDILENFDQKYAKAKAKHEQILKSLNFEYNIDALEQEFFEALGINLKFGVYDNYGLKKDLLKDLIIYNTINEESMISLKQYVVFPVPLFP